MHFVAGFFLSLGMDTNIEHKVFEVSINSVNQVVSQIRRDIKYLERRTPPNDIKIAIPLYYQKLLRLYVNEQTIYPVGPEFREYFGAQVILGYNNQICVFDAQGYYNSDFCQPITLVNEL